MPSRDISPEELREDLEEVKAGVRDIIHRFDRLDQVYVRRDVADERDARRVAQLEALRAEIAALSGRVQWAARAAASGVLFPLLVATIAFFLLRGSG
jgi:predicted aminopeptidase